MPNILLTLLLLAVACSSQLSAEIIALQSNQLQFEYRVDNVADAGDGNVDFIYRGVDYGISEAWFLSTGGSTAELVGGTVVDGADTAHDQVNWSVDQGDLQFAIDFFANGEFPAGPVNGVSIAMNVSLFNSSSEIVSGTLSNYSDMEILGIDNGSLVASDSLDDTSLITSQEDAVGLTSYSIKSWNTASLFGEPIFGEPATGWAIASIEDNLLGSLRAGEPLDNADGVNIFTSDITGAAQWGFELAPQTGILIQSDLAVFNRAVPEPNSALIFGLFGLVFLRRARMENLRF